MGEQTTRGGGGGTMATGAAGAAAGRMAAAMPTAATAPRFRDRLPAEVDVAVIGAGIAGTATAWFLARRGWKVLLAEKGRVAGEQSGRNWGWVRQQGRDAAELPIAMEANRIWRRLARETGEAGLAFTASACVKLAGDARALAAMEGWRQLAAACQLDTRMLSPGEIADLLPALRGNFAGGMTTASDGRAEPWEAVPALARAAQAEGAAVIEDCAVRCLDLAGGRIAGAVTERGRVVCERAVLAGGAWSGLFAANAGIRLPQLAVRSTAAATGPAEGEVAFNLSLPGLAVRRRDDGRYTVSTGDIAEHYLAPESLRHARRFVPLIRRSARDLRLKPAAPAGYPGSWRIARRWHGGEESPFERLRVLHPAPSPTVLRRLRRRLPRHLPFLNGAGLAEAWAGMIDVTPDAVPMLGEIGPPGLLVATGFSGHGFGIGPAIGRILADLIAGRDPGHDLARFRPQRFHDGTPIVPGPY